MRNNSYIIVDKYSLSLKDYHYLKAHDNPNNGYNVRVIIVDTSDKASSLTNELIFVDESIVDEFLETQDKGYTIANDYHRYPVVLH